jgi:hypothetical protein
MAVDIHVLSSGTSTAKPTSWCGNAPLVRNTEGSGRSLREPKTGCAAKDGGAGGRKRRHQMLGLRSDIYTIQRLLIHVRISKLQKIFQKTDRFPE